MPAGDLAFSVFIFLMVALICFIILVGRRIVSSPNLILILYFLGNTILQIPVIRNLGILFYGTSLSLICIYILFSAKLKSSLHLVSMGNMLGFFLIMTNINSLSMLPIIILLILLSGILASSRLYLKAHTPVELLIGFFLGIVCQFILFITL